MFNAVSKTKSERACENIRLPRRLQVGHSPLRRSSPKYSGGDQHDSLRRF
jgi:hypothetical protein